MGRASRARWRAIDRTLAAVLATAAVAVGAVVVVQQRTAAPVPVTSSSASPQPRGYQIEFRPVITEGPALTGGCPVIPSASTAAMITACNPDGSIIYTLGAPVVQGNEIAMLTVQREDVGGAWVVHVRLNHDGTSHFATMTAALAQLQIPQNQVPSVAHGVVQGSPSVQAPILGGEAVLSGFQSEAEALALVTSVPP